MVVARRPVESLLCDVKAALDGRGSEQPLILERRPRCIIQTRRKTTRSVEGNRHSGTSGNSFAEQEMMLYLALFLFLPFATAAPAALVSEGAARSKDFSDEHGEDDRIEIDIGKEGIISIERAPLVGYQPCWNRLLPQVYHLECNTSGHFSVKSELLTTKFIS
ncbi:uncharacterized protein LOC109933250 isoform X2 [Rhincodon typus]|uniref:uncharacterized protein LOC109933250 isoform X2 n=1 Tax=Rhincodon typus TaxID=259920 RepID=UPI0009A38726|nr:uncharacterized protein LOC109933250 isoform X2 [Rhincodon typus]